MTTGQRVAQKRKELGLSQEALGEKLGVSRQSIYKWESDSALPEVEKLVALSRLFDVSVGWLLGVEEEPPPGEAELTEAQLNMVEEIAARYAPRLSPKRLAVLKVSVAVAALCLCGVLWGFYRKMDRLSQHYYFLQSDITEVQRNLDTRIDGVSDRMETLFREQNAVTSDYGAVLEIVDPSTSSASFQVYAVPKTYMEGMTAEFCTDSGSCRSSAVRTNGRFEAELRCGLTEDITLSVVFTYPDGSSQTQILDHYEGLYGQTFPNVRAELSLNQREAEDGLLLSGDGVAERVYLDYGPPSAESDLPVAEVQSARVGLFKNRKLVDWAVFQAVPGALEEETSVLTGAQWAALDALRDHGESGTKGYQIFPVSFPEGKTAVEPGDVLESVLVIRDIYGRTAVRAWRAYGLDERQGVLTELDREPPDAYPAGWMLADGSSICS